MIYLELFLTFLKIGAFTFGGGYAMLPLIQEQTLAHGWVSQEELINFIAVSESTPGPFAINISTYIGMTVGGFPGALCATLGAALPSFIVILIIAKFIQKFRTNKIVAGCMSGLKPAVIGMIGAAVISVGKTVFFESGVSLGAFGDVRLWISAVLFLVMSVLAFKKVHPIKIICVSAVCGIIAGYALEMLNIT